MEKRYPSDLTDEQWNIIKPLIPDAKPGGRPCCTDLRALMVLIEQFVNGVIYLRNIHRARQYLSILRNGVKKEYGIL